MLAGLLGATALGGIAPAYAQAGLDRGDRGPRAERPDGGRGAWRGEGRPEGRGDNRGQWMQRGGGDMRPARGNPVIQPGVDRPGRELRGAEWRQRAAPVGAGQMAPPRPDPRWRGDPDLPANRAVEDQVRRAREQRPDWRQDRRDDRRDGRQEWRDERRDDRRDWRQDRQDWRQDRRDDRQDWRQDRRDDRRWDDRNRDGRDPNWRDPNWRDRDGRDRDGRGWNGGGWSGNDWNRGTWNGGRRFDDRTRWSTQRRWDNGWRQDRRYDWRAYRDRYGDRYRVGRYYAPRGWTYGYRSFSVGIFLDSLLYRNDYWINDPFSYRLPPAYGTLRWVRYYDDALLVDVRDGYVVDVIRDFFW